jgi:hypothetical protein
MAALAQKRGNISRALSYGHNLNELALNTIDNKVRAYRPKQDGVSGEIIQLVPHSGVPGQLIEGVEESPDPAVGGCDIVLGNVLKDFVQVQFCASA